MGAPKIFKLSDFSIIRRSDKQHIYSSKAVGSVTYTQGPEIMEQRTGPSNFPVEAAVGSFSSECAINLGDYDPELLEVIGNLRTITNSVSAGLITEALNFKGEVLSSSGNVILSLALGTDVKSGWYRLVIKDIAAKTADLFALSSPDLLPSQYNDFNSRLVSTITLADNMAVDLGIGVNAQTAVTVDLTNEEVGNGFTFRVFASGRKAATSVIGERVPVTETVTINCLGRKIEDGRWSELVLDRVLLSGVNYNFGDEFSANEVTGRGLYDDTTHRVGQFYTYEM